MKAAGTRILACTIIAIHSLISAPAQAGIDVSLNSELAQLGETRALLDDIEAAQTEEDFRELEARWQRLMRRTQSLKARLTSGQSRIPEGEQARQIDQLHSALDDLARDVQTYQDAVAAHFPQARNRVAFFALDDPDQLGAGDALGFVLSKHLLFSAATSSFAIVNFQQRLAPERPGGLAYFDKVEQLTRDQGYSLALWGRLARTRGGARMTLFGQAFPDASNDRYGYEYTLPEAMGGGVLLVALDRHRFRIFDDTVSNDLISELPRIADAVRTLRASPDATAPVVGRIDADRPHFVRASRGDWVQIAVRGGVSGWTSVRAFCTEECATLLGAADFANGVLAAGDRRSPWEPAAYLNDDTRLVYRELSAINALRSADTSAALEIARGEDGAINSAGLANLASVAMLADGLSQQSGAWNSRAVPASVYMAQVDTLKSASALSSTVNQNFRTLFAQAEQVPDVDPQWFRQTTLTEHMTRKKWALVIVSDKYRHLHNVSTWRPDADRVSAALRGSGYAVDVLANATRRRIAGVLKAHEADDESVIYVAGHVRAGSDGIVFPLVGYNRENPNPGAVLSLEQLTDGVQGVRTVVIGAPLASDTARRIRAKGASVLFGVRVPDAPRVDIGAGPVSYFYSDALEAGRDVDGNRDGLIDPEELATFMSQRASALKVPLNVRTVRPARAGKSYAMLPRIELPESVRSRQLSVPERRP